MVRSRLRVAVAILPFFTLAACASTTTVNVRPESLPLGPLIALECRDSSGNVNGDAREPLKVTAVDSLEHTLSGCPESVSVRGARSTTRFESPRRIVRDEAGLTFVPQDGEAPILVRVEPGDTVEFVVPDEAGTASMAVIYVVGAVFLLFVTIAFVQFLDDPLGG